MKNNVTELVFILDRSGSMSGLESDTIGGFNSMIEKQKRQDDSCYVSTVLFDSESEVLHDRVKLSNIQPMTDRDYTVRGCTALIDALGGAIRHIGSLHKYARSEDVPAHTLFIITTDGAENASHRYSAEEVRKMNRAAEKNTVGSFCSWALTLMRRKGQGDMVSARIVRSTATRTARARRSITEP